MALPLESEAETWISWSNTDSEVLVGYIEASGTTLWWFGWITSRENSRGLELVSYSEMYRRTDWHMDSKVLSNNIMGNCGIFITWFLSEIPL